MSKQRRMKPAARKDTILAAAMTLAEGKIYTHLTRDEIAEAVGITGPGVQHHFKTMKQLRGDLMRYAVKHRVLCVIAQGLAAGDPHAARADEALRREAMNSLMEAR